MAAAYYEQRYDGEIRYVDSEIGRLLDAVRAAGKWESTLVVLTADHGELMGDADAPDAAFGGPVHAPVERDPVFGFDVVTQCHGVPADVLLPRNTWANKDDFDRMAADLAGRFKKNFKQFELPGDDVRNAGPR